MERRRLAKMESPYAVAIEGPLGHPRFYAASEAREAPALVFNGPDGPPTVVARGPGGCMGIVPLGPAGLPGMLMVEEFFPIFQSDRSGAAVYLPPVISGGEWRRHRVFDLPFLHRIAWVNPHGRPQVLAAQLCRAKEHMEDWSHPGAVYAVEPGAASEPWRVCEKPLLDGLHRNHGMFIRRANGQEEVFVSGDEGIFRLSCPAPDQPWVAERVLDLPTSDLWMFDLDGDGEEELVAIHPFHGETARIFKRAGSRWEIVWEVQGKFGHVVWAGRLRGQPCVMLGWRGGDQALDLHFLEDARAWRFQKMTLDAGVAPLNAVVRHERGADLVLATHATPGEVVLYSLR
ncbi:MAG: hypothetical protein ACOYMV_09625 [Verrucomicrobiia bacterium]